MSHGHGGGLRGALAFVWCCVSCAAAAPPAADAARSNDEARAPRSPRSASSAGKGQTDEEPASSAAAAAEDDAATDAATRAEQGDVRAANAIRPAFAICQAKCEQMRAKCSKAAVASCRLNCTKYDPPPTGCESQVRVALECARDARDLTCANVAPESCAAKFRDLAACSAGEAPPTAAAADAKLPEGWERVSEPRYGFTVVMPKGSTESAGPGDPELRVATPEGTQYSVSVLPPPEDKPTQKSLLHFLMKAQGRCSDKVKLDGFVEKADRSSIHYTAHCPDQTDWNGMVYIDDRHLVLLSARAAVGKLGLTEPFFYEFSFDH